MRGLRWLMLNGIMLVVFYFGYVEGVVPAKGVFLFWAWISVISQLGFASKNFKIEFNKRANGKRVVSAIISIPYDFVLLCAIVWFGNYPLAFFYLVTAIWKEQTWQEIEGGKYV